MPKYLQILLTLVCLVILAPVVFGIIEAIAVVFGVGVLAVLEFAGGIGRWFAHYALAFSIVGFAVIGWLFVRARKRPIPGSPPPVLGSERPLN
jgi:hypothetical protein